MNVISSRHTRRARFHSKPLARAGTIGVIAVVLVSTASSASAEPGTITEYGPMPTPLAAPCEVEWAPDGRLWIQEVTSNQLARMDLETQEIEEFPLPTPGAMTAGMEFGPDGNLWMPEFVGNQILRIDPVTAEMTEFPMPWGALPTPVPLGTALSDDIDFGSDGAAWFTLNGLNAIGRMDLETGEMTKYQIPTPGALPIIIKPGPGDTMVFPMAGANKIGTIDVHTKEIREYPIPTPNSAPQGVGAGPDGMIWFTGTAGQQLGKIDPASGQVTEYSILSLRNPPVIGDLGPSNPLPFPGPLVFGADGNLYFAEGNLSLLGNKIGKFNPRTKKLAEFITPSPASGPCYLNEQRDGEIWFGEFSANKVGVLRYRCH